MTHRCTRLSGGIAKQQASALLAVSKTPSVSTALRFDGLMERWVASRKIRRALWQGSCRTHTDAYRQGLSFLPGLGEVKPVVRLALRDWKEAFGEILLGFQPISGDLTPIKPIEGKNNRLRQWLFLATVLAQKVPPAAPGNLREGEVKILLADDQELVRDTIAAFLRLERGVEVDVAADFPAALALVRQGGVHDLVLLDYMMPGMNGLAGLAAMRAAVPGVPVAILSGTAPRAVAEQALAEGASGFLPKTMSTKTLIAAIRFMIAGEVYAPMALMTEREAPSATLAGAQLTARETEVLRFLCQGLANKEIARELDLQEVTVKLHVKTLYRKIDARNRTHAAMIAKQAGLF